MATKPAVQTDAATAETETDTTLLDVQSASVKRLIAKGKERGYITFDELNAVLPPEQNSSEQIEDVMANLNEMGIQVVEAEEAEEGEPPAPAKVKEEAEEEEPTGNVDEESLGRTDDPVRMYLREMGSVELLSREGEIAIAKRIEAGRDMMIGGLCESPLTFRAIVAWHDALKAGRMLLRDIVDLEATQGGPAPPADRGARRGRRGPGAASRGRRPSATRRADHFERPPDDEEAEEGEGAGLSLSALKEKLKPEVLATFEEIENLYKKLHKMQQKRLDTMTSGEDVNVRSEKALREAARGTGRQGRAGAAAQQPHRGTGHPAQAAQPAADRAGRPAAAHGGKLQGGARRFPHTSTAATSSTPTGWRRSASCRARPGRPSPARHPERHRQAARPDRRRRDRRRPADQRIPPRLRDRQPRRTRQRARQEGNDRGQPAPGDLDRQEIHQPRPAVPRPDPGRQHRPDEGGGQVRVPPRLQVLDLRHLVDPPGDHPLDRRPGPHHPHPGAHDRDDQQAGAHLAPDAARDRPRAGARRNWPRSSACRWRKSARC